MTYTGIIQSSDGLAMFATAESIARRGEADMNQLLWMGNQQGNIGPDGKHQNLVYSPDNGRFYLTATIGLDSLYERIRGKPDDGPGGPGGGGRGLTKGMPPPGLGAF